ncbi:hypothetical protein GP486_000303 [Trichoglossum hirsutum]|uniref:DUF6594 domain-containing protein n=1 Tax=Trichoglossum hirsutum TaxID=265104 RepID=A0A9P8LJ70_9PEZI|nr:hypothetical protein GP486_000303 [Trichoglossum hirsutum]
MEKPEQYKYGLEKLGKFMGEYPGMAIVRGYSALNMRNILVLQAEIADFEAMWEDIMEENREPGVNQRCSVADMKDANSPKWQKTLELRKLLKEYNDAVLQQKQMNELEPANKRDLICLREFLIKGLKLVFPAEEWMPWDEKNTSDLIALSNRYTERDLLTRWVFDSLIRWLHASCLRRWKRPIDEESGLYDYSDKALATTANVISAVISGLLPVLAIVVLYNVHRQAAKIGVIVGFTALFSVALASIAKCRRIEVFAATAA